MTSNGCRSGPQPLGAEHDVQHRVVRSQGHVQARVQAVSAGQQLAEPGAAAETHHAETRMKLRAQLHLRFNRLLALVRKARRGTGNRGMWAGEAD